MGSHVICVSSNAARKHTKIIAIEAAEGCHYGFARGFVRTHKPGRSKTQKYMGISNNCNRSDKNKKTQ